MQNGLSVGPATKKKKNYLYWSYFLKGGTTIVYSTNVLVAMSPDFHVWHVLCSQEKPIRQQLPKGNSVWFLPGLFQAQPFGECLMPLGFLLVHRAGLMGSCISKAKHKDVQEDFRLINNVLQCYLKKKKKLLSSNITTNFLILIYICPMGFSPIKID